MNRYQGLLRTMGWALLSAASIIMGYYAWRMLTGEMNTLSPVLRCILLVCAPLFSGTALLALSMPEEAERAKVVRAVLWVLFGFYLLALCATLVFSRIDFADYAAQRAAYMADWELMTSFTPFETIGLYIRCLKYDFIGTAIPVSNLMGNVLLFMPMAVFLPCLFPSTRRFLRFLVLMVAILLAVEALQLVLCCGSCDIDDVILNLSGTLLVYGLMALPAVQKILIKTYLFSPAAPAAQA